MCSDGVVRQRYNICDLGTPYFKVKMAVILNPTVATIISHFFCVVKKWYISSKYQFTRYYAFWKCKIALHTIYNVGRGPEPSIGVKSCKCKFIHCIMARQMCLGVI